MLASVKYFSNIVESLLSGNFKFLHAQIFVIKLAKAVYIFLEQMNFAVISKLFQLQGKRENVVSQRVNFGNVEASGRKFCQNVLRCIVGAHKEILRHRPSLVNQGLTCILERTT